MIFLSAVLFILILIFIMKTFVIVPQQMAYIKERFGEYRGTLEAGWHFLIPFIDKISYRHTLKEETIDVPPQRCITKDNVQVEVDGLLYIKCVDPVRASYGINDYHFAAIQLAQTNMRSEMGKIDLDRTFEERDAINSALIDAIDKASDPWGIKVTRYEIKNILPPQNILHVMEKQMTAERDKRAEISRSEGERAATINRSEGERTESINVSEGEKIRRINEAEGRAKQIELVADASAQAIREVAMAITEPGGDEAVKVRIAEDFIARFGHIIGEAKTTVVPLGPATIQSTFQGLSELVAGVKQGGGKAHG